MRRNNCFLGCLLLLLQQKSQGDGIQQSAHRQLQATIDATTGDLTVLAGTDFCCSNGLPTSTSSASAAAKNRRMLNTQPHIGWTDPGDWVAYPVEITSAGTYQVHFHVSSPFGDGGFELVDLQTQQLYGTVDTMPVTTSWDTFETISLPVTLPAGLVSLQIRLLSAGWNLLWLAVSSEDSVGSIPGVIVPPPSPDVILSPDTTAIPTIPAVSNPATSTVAPNVTVAFDEVTSFPSMSSSSSETIMPTPNNATSPVLPMPTPNTIATPSVPSIPVAVPVPAPSATLPSPLATAPIPSPLAGPTSTLPSVPAAKPPHNKRPFLHEFITFEDFTRTSPDIVWQTSETEQRTQAVELKTGDWMEFQLAIPVAGPYQVHVRTSSPNGEGSFELVHVEMNELTRNETEVSLGMFTGFPTTGSWEEYLRMEQEITLPASPLGDGLLMRINVLEPGFSLSWLYIEPSDLWDAIDARDDAN
ncbi:hypothetical protein FisN_7Hu400 [Fistulifera solaris]|jgi:hypothetical protein|uniref:CBM6 domain-containing protein n=1 Tax=Fistulifera solaris TaxID=1519565 RepID=A0A1Z5KRU7_FISSO|nr:hypothetical protein FisN_7Hu400 [Fistulifera solaris]|eukprot:GAX29009.1 hypothetical protein FisN_7Hu400 [Fistulifera solaris]